jgi:magnesium chelatase subunit D
VCAAFEVDGMRADLVTARAAVALAAWRGLRAVTADEVRDAARLALPHRRRRNPFDAPGLDEDQLDEALRDQDDEDPPPDAGPHGPGGGGDGDQEPGNNRPTGQELDDGGSTSATSNGNSSNGNRQEAEPSGTEANQDSSSQPARLADSTSGNQPADGAPRSVPEQAAVAPGEPYRTKLFAVPGVGEGVPGRRSAGRSAGRGRTVGDEVPRGAATALHLPATVRAAAVHQAGRGRTAGSASPLLLRAEDLRSPLRRDREGNLVLFVVDASGSMAARARMAAVKGAVLSLLLDAYQRRDKVGMVTFRGEGAQVALPPTTSVEAAAARLRMLPTGGRTPLAAGLLCAADVVRRERLRDPRRRPLLVIVTDGRATSARTGTGTPTCSGTRAIQADVQRVASHIAACGTASMVVDCETGPVRLALAAQLAVHLGGEHVPMAELAATGQPEPLAAAVRASVDQKRPLNALGRPAPHTPRKAA